MSNALTGDFDAVLQVSGGTINRLLASMHQNAFEDPKLPSFPHTVRMRIGDGQPFEGVRGVVRAQLSVPRVELIHGATDRFFLEVGVRAWYRHDPGTEPLATFIHGTVRAEYRAQDIDPSCLGWGDSAGDFLWLRVVRDSVTFRGTAEDESSGTDVAIGASPATGTSPETIARITRQIAWQLATRFEAKPHPLKEGFKRGSLRSLNVPLAGSAVVMPLALNGEPQGDIGSIDNLLVEGKHFAFAVSVGYITSLVKSMLPLQFPRVEVGPPTVAWQPQTASAVIKIQVKGTAALSGLPNVTVTINQDINLGFDVGGGLWLSPGALQVTIDWDPVVHALAGVGRQLGVLGRAVLGSSSPSLDLIGTLHREIQTGVQTAVQNACKDAQSTLDAMTGRTATLINQLQTLDKQASIAIDDASFLPDGIILRGQILLSAGRRPVVTFAKTADENGYSALDSWIPGGRIDKLQWSWSWAGSGKPGKATFYDRFLLRRPSGEISRWGLLGSITTPIPGLDGYGEVCLQISGEQVDPITGDLKPVFSRERCTRFGGFLTTLVSERGRLFLRDMPQLSTDVPFPQLKQRPLLAVPRGLRGAGTTNTLLIHVDEAWNGEIAETLVAGLRACGRYDARLSVLVLFREGMLEARGVSIVEDIEMLMRGLGVAAHVNEDVDGAWSRALHLRGGSGGAAWAIIAPDGTLAWSHEGRIGHDTLASALDAHLRSSRDFVPLTYPRLEVGSRVDDMALNPTWREPKESPCPPIVLGHRETVITFVHKQSPASVTHLRQLAGRAPQVFVVVDGADERETESLKRELGTEFVAIPDPSGTISDGFDIGVWPTTITLNRAGIISEVEFGVLGASDSEARRRDEALYRGHAAL